jgi:hypothetical protein
MNELLLIVIVILIVLYAVYKNKIHDYNKIVISGIKYSLNLLKTNKILLLIVIVIPVINYFAYYVVNIAKSNYIEKQFGFLFESANKFVVKEYTIYSFIVSLKDTMDSLFNPLPFSIPNFIFSLLIVIIIPFYTIIIRKLNDKVHNPTYEYDLGIQLMYKVCKYSFRVIYSLIAVLLVSVLAFKANDIVFTFIALINVATIPIYLVVIAYMHKYLIQCIADRKVKSGKAITISFENYSMIIYGTIIISIIMGIPAIISIILKFANLISISSPLTYFENYLMYVEFVIKIVLLLYLMVPAIISLQNKQLSIALKSNISIIKNNYLLYLYLILMSLVPLLIMQIMYDYMYLTYQMNYFSLLLNSVFIVLRNSIVAIFYITMIRTFIVNNKK